ncbi:unnamed protein product [Ascophyllum nodosum]
MVNVRNKKCTTEGCGKEPSFGVSVTKTVEYCTQHAPDGMVNVRKKRCITEGCDRESTFGVAGTKTAKFCTQHAPDGMVNVRNKKCITGRLRQDPVVRNARYKNGEVLSTACNGRDGQR